MADARLAPMTLQELIERVHLEQRHVAVEQERRARLPAEHGLGLQQRVARPKLGGLGDELEVWVGSQRRLDRLGPVADDHRRGCGIQGLGCPHHVLDDGQSGQSVDHLGQGTTSCESPCRQPE